MKRLTPRSLFATGAELEDRVRVTAFTGNVTGYLLLYGAAGWLEITTPFAQYLRSGDVVDLPTISFTPSTDDPIPIPANSYVIEKTSSTTFIVRLAWCPGNSVAEDTTFTTDFACVAHILFVRASFFGQKALRTANTANVYVGPYQQESILITPDDGTTTTPSLALALDAQSYDDLADWWIYNTSGTENGVHVLFHE